MQSGADPTVEDKSDPPKVMYLFSGVKGCCGVMSDDGDRSGLQANTECYLGRAKWTNMHRVLGKTRQHT